MQKNAKPESKSPWQTVSENLVRYKSSGTYYSCFRKNGKPAKRQSLGTKDFATAKRALAQRKAEADKPKAKSITLKEMLEDYKKTITKLSLSSQTREKILCKKLEDYFGNIAVAELRGVDLEAFLNKRIEDGGAASSYNEDLRELNKILKMAVREHYLPQNPIGHVERMRRNTPLKDTPSAEEFEAILENVGAQKDNRDAKDSVEFLEFMGRQGVGNSEAANLKWKHVMFDAGQIGELRLFRNKTKTPYEPPIFPATLPMLKKMWDASDKLPESNVFKIKNARKALTNACKRLQLPHYTQRSLRRMFITKCIYLNIPPSVIGDWQGHSDNGATILNDYAQTIASLNRNLARLVV